MEEFEIAFVLNGNLYQASVKKSGNLYYVTPQDAELAQAFGEATLLEANGDFAWANPSPEYYRYALCIANALKIYLGSKIID